MSTKKNYSKMYSTEEERVTPDVENTPVEAETVEAPAEKPVAKKKPKTLKGVVVNCAKLNVREQMSTSAAVLCVLPAASEVKVFAEESHPEWEHVVTDEGVEGFCMKKYIAINK